MQLTSQSREEKKKIERRKESSAASSFSFSLFSLRPSLDVLSLMAPKDDPALGERDVAAANGGDAADGIADAEAVSFVLLLSGARAF